MNGLHVGTGAQAGLRRRGLLSLACLATLAPHTTILKAMPAQLLRAEDFFTGQLLDMAQAIERGDLATLQALAKDTDPARPGARGLTLLWFAMQPARQNLAAVAALLRLGVDPDQQIVVGSGSALNAALNSPNTALLQAMLDGGLSPGQTYADDTTLLMRAAGAEGGLAPVKVLVERGAALDARDSIGGTALHSAVSTMQPQIALYLIERGASVNTATVNGVTLAWSVQRVIERQQPGPMRRAFEDVREAMARRGVKFPATPPSAVRQGRVNAAGKP